MQRVKSMAGALMLALAAAATVSLGPFHDLSQAPDVSAEFESHNRDSHHYYSILPMIMVSSIIIV